MAKPKKVKISVREEIADDVEDFADRLEYYLDEQEALEKRVEELEEENIALQATVEEMEEQLEESEDEED